MSGQVRAVVSHMSRWMIVWLFAGCAAAAPGAERASVVCPPSSASPTFEPEFAYRELPAEPAIVDRELPAEPPPPAIEPPDPSPAFSLVRREEDLDGDGDVEVLEVFSDGHVTLGEGSSYVHLEEPPLAPGAEWHGGLELVDVRRGDGFREVLFWQRAAESEDPPDLVMVFSVRGAAVFALREHLALSGRARPIIRGDGRIRMERSFCDGGHLMRIEVEHRMERNGTIRFLHSHRDLTAATCLDAACPHVFVGAERPRFAGEILRNLVGAGAEAEQSLALPLDAVEPDGMLTVELREQEPEVSYVDTVALRVDGRRIAPIDCDAAPWCAADGSYLTMSLGDSRTIRFDVGANARSIELIARGYYVPTP